MRHSARSSVLSVIAVISIALGVSQAATVPAGFTETQIANGFFSPAGMDFAADGRLFVGEQKGRIRVILNDSTAPVQVMNLQLKVDYNTERGFQGLVLDPNFLTNGYLYVFYTAKGPTVTTSRMRLSRFTVVNNAADTAQETVLFELPNLPSRGGSFQNQNVGSGSTTLAVWHMGGGLVFGNDGKIYVGVGEHEVTTFSQSKASLFGKVLRLNPDGSIPTDNPFYGSDTGTSRAIYATGMRNPFTFGIQRSTGRIMMADVGDGTWEEVDTLTPGGNYGWGTCEGNHATGSTSNLCSISNQVKPLFTYRHGTTNTTGNCVIAGDFASSFRTEDNGQFFFGDFPNDDSQTRGWIKRINPNGGGDTITFATGVSNITGLKFSPKNGALYYVTRGYRTGVIDTSTTTTNLNRGRVMKIAYTGPISILPSSKPRVSGGLVVDMYQRTLLIPTGMAGIEVFNLSGRQVWSAADLRAGEKVEIPRLQAGVLKYRWIASRH